MKIMQVKEEFNRPVKMTRYSFSSKYDLEVIEDRPESIELK
jgi:hypothetical protein